MNRLWGIIYKNRKALSAGLKTTEESIDSSRLTSYALRLYRKTHQIIKKVTTDIDREYHFNTAIAGLMELMNDLASYEPGSDEDLVIFKFAIERLLLLLSPFSPHIAEELWETIGNKPSIFEQGWPHWDEQAAKEENIELVIQVNGKVRSKIMIPADTHDNEIKGIALDDKKIKEIIGAKSIKKVIIVKGKLVNIVIGE